MKKLLLLTALVCSSAWADTAQDERELSFWYTCATLYNETPQYDHDRQALQAASGQRIALLQRRYSAADFQRMHKRVAESLESSWQHWLDYEPVLPEHCRAAAEQVLN